MVSLPFVEHMAIRMVNIVVAALHFECEAGHWLSEKSRAGEPARCVQFGGGFNRHAWEDDDLAQSTFA